LRHDEYSYNDIATDTGFNKGFISKLIKRFREHGDVLYDERVSNRCPEILTQGEKVLIQEELHNDCQTTLSTLSEKSKMTFHYKVSLKQFTIMR